MVRVLLHRRVITSIDFHFQIINALKCIHVSGKPLVVTVDCCSYSKWLRPTGGSHNSCACSSNGETSTEFPSWTCSWSGSFRIGNTDLPSESDLVLFFVSEGCSYRCCYVFYLTVTRPEIP